MEPRKSMVCTCENCGNGAELTFKCEEVMLDQNRLTSQYRRQPGR
jgi:hypothetical protein